MDHTYKITEIVGSSPEGIDAAIRSGIGRASKTLRNLDWFEVTDIRGAMNEGDIAWFQVTMKVGFRLEDGTTDSRVAQRRRQPSSSASSCWSRLIASAS